jgi:hypothetical protein
MCVKNTQQKKYIIFHFLFKKEKKRKEKKNIFSHVYKYTWLNSHVYKIHVANCTFSNIWINHAGPTRPTTHGQQLAMRMTLIHMANCMWLNIKFFVAANINFIYMILHFLKNMSTLILYTQLNALI